MKEEVQKYITEILSILKEKIPSDWKHNFQLGEDGRLWLWIKIGDQYQSIIFDEEYEDKTAKEITDLIFIDLTKAGYIF
jgi:hypothetical protein